MENSFYRFKVGDFQCTVLSDGYLMIPPPPGSSGQKGGEQGQKTDISCLYIDTGTHQVLVDTGCGQGFQSTTGFLLQNMRAAGIKPADVDRIIITHGHSDHTGGSFDKEGRPVFPNARHIIAKSEWECLVNRPESSHLTPLFATARQAFLSKPQRFEMVGDKAEVISGIKLTTAPGHSPGHALLEISSRGQELLCIGDLIHLDLEFQRPSYLSFLDINPEQAIQSRNEVFAQAAETKRKVFACHFDFPGVGYIVRKGSGFGWEPVDTR
jgi:glyoxylase-like metal-dependent hydrolase (beta-lactamase superfamily II)